MSQNTDACWLCHKPETWTQFGMASLFATGRLGVHPHPDATHAAIPCADDGPRTEAEDEEESGAQAWMEAKSLSPAQSACMIICQMSSWSQSWPLLCGRRMFCTTSVRMGGSSCELDRV